MKRIFLSSVLFASLGLLLTGCLKDKGFDNGEYGINDPDTQPPGVGFPLAASAKYTVGLDVSATAQVVNDVVYVNLESGSPAPADVQITLTLNDALRTAYNTTNGTNILALSSTLYNVATTMTIPAGARNVQIPITVSNTTGLDPNASYGVGITISDVSGNYTIARNLKNLLLEFTIKNKYDGKYQLTGFHNRPGLDLPYDETVLMITSGPSSVYMFWPALGAAAHPLNGGTTYYGSFTANFIFNPTTNLLTAWDWTPYATTLSTQIGPATDSRWDPADKTIYAQFYYNGNAAARGFKDTLRYLGPR
jgi:hypothetical protein